MRMGDACYQADRITALIMESNTYNYIAKTYRERREEDEKERDRQAEKTEEEAMLI